MDLLSHFDSLEFHNEEPSSPPEEFHAVIEDILSGPASTAPTNSPGLQSSNQQEIAIWFFIGGMQRAMGPAAGMVIIVY